MRIFVECPNIVPFSVRERAPGLGWFIDILWPDGETEVIKGFTTKQQAAEWAGKHSENWRENNK
jgi:hypothetical protein